MVEQTPVTLSAASAGQHCPTTCAGQMLAGCLHAAWPQTQVGQQPGVCQPARPSCCTSPTPAGLGLHSSRTRSTTAGLAWPQWVLFFPPDSFSLETWHRARQKQGVCLSAPNTHPCATLLAVTNHHDWGAHYGCKCRPPGVHGCSSVLLTVGLLPRGWELRTGPIKCRILALWPGFLYPWKVMSLSSWPREEGSCQPLPQACSIWLIIHLLLCKRG